MTTYWTKEGCFGGVAPKHTFLHREDGPAAEYDDGTKIWYFEGKRHRLDGPAIEWADGGKEWWVNGKRHREDGPADEWADGSKEWWRAGRRHREDAPAIEFADGEINWYLDDYDLTLEEFIKETPYLASDAERLSFYLRWK